MPYQSETKQCQNCKQSFTIELEDFEFYAKIQVPPPTFCPECRLVRRLAWRNEKTLYRRDCDLCKKRIVSNFSPASKRIVYCSPCWWSDNWDPMEYGMDYDFNKPFFEQYKELSKIVPVMSLSVGYLTMINSDYCHMATYLKNCYFVTHSESNEDCFYSSDLRNSKDCGEMLSCSNTELSLENTNCYKCFKIFFSLDCRNCHNVYFSNNLINCSDCFGCVNLRNKKYHIFNKEYSNEEYFKKLKELDLGSYKKIQQAEKNKNELPLLPKKYIHGHHNSNVIGDYIYNSKNAINCYIAEGVEDSKFCQYVTAKVTTRCYDYTEWGYNANLVYDSVNCGEGFVNSKFNSQSWKSCQNIEYTNFCVNSSDIFGCISLRKKQFCIFNKQYSEKDYKNIRDKIIKQMLNLPYSDKVGRVYKYGEFFPIELSAFGYNETTAQEFFPLSENEIKEKGYYYVDIDNYKGKYNQTMKANEMPDHIKDINESILKEIIQCLECKKSYNITKQEFNFYKNQRIALPRKCPDCRYERRFKQRNPLKLCHRKCQCAGKESDNKVYENTIEHLHHKKEHCSVEFETSYSPERPEIVYCEKCYQQEVA